MTPPDDAARDRRPVAARASGWARAAAARLARSRVTADQVSVASVAFAAAGAALLLWAPAPAGPLGCAAAIQARLICNLLDGMVALEGGKKSAFGRLYNEFPDRVADSVLLIALGHAAGWPALGWLAALAAALTAYVRVFGATLGQPQDFRGPMAKQHRMAVMTVGCVAAAAERPLAGSTHALAAALAVIALGALLTCATRTRAIARRLQQEPPAP